ncbi:MAG: PHP domain-containing protein, partial [Spirochaetota bacterium]
MSRRSYVPLRVRSTYSFLEGASHPDELMGEATRLRLPAVSLTDRDGVYGIVQAHQALREQADALSPGSAVPRLLIGSEVTVELPGVTSPGDPTPIAATPGDPDRRRTSLVLLAADREGYARLCGLISAGRMRSPKGESVVTLEELCGSAVPAPRASASPAPRASAEGRGDGSGGLIALWTDATDGGALGSLSDAFAGALYIAHARHYRPGDPAAFAEQRRLAERYALPLVAATETLYHAVDRRELHDVVTCIRYGMTLNEAGARLRPNASHAMLSAQEMYRRYSDVPELVTRTLEVAERCAFSLDAIDYRYPNEQVPAGYTTSEWLWELAFAGARRRYGGSIPADVRAQLQKELALIDELEYGGYFL